MQEVFSMGEIARLCQVAPRTATKWFDSGILKGWRMPPSSFRRVSRAALVEFLKQHNMPTIEELEQIGAGTA